MLFCSFNISGQNPLLELVAESIMQAALGGLEWGVERVLLVQAIEMSVILGGQTMDLVSG